MIIEDYTTQFCGDCNKTIIRIPIKQPVFQWKVRPFFFMAQLTASWGCQLLKWQGVWKNMSTVWNREVNFGDQFECNIWIKNEYDDHSLDTKLIAHSQMFSFLKQSFMFVYSFKFARSFDRNFEGLKFKFQQQKGVISIYKQWVTGHYVDRTT